MSVSDLGLYQMMHYRSVEALCDLLTSRKLRGEETVLLAGGTDWMVEQEMAKPQAPEQKRPIVVDISRMAELREIRREEGTLRIGAAATFLEIRRNPHVNERVPLLERMARDVGAVQIQARGTLGGNLATQSPAADGVAALAALDATIVVRSSRGERRIPFSELQTGYKKSTRAADELFVAVEIVMPPRGAPWIWRKVGARRAQAISKVALAGVAEVEDGQTTRFGVGMASVAPVTALLPSLRALARSKSLAEITGEEIDRAVDSDVSPIDDVRSTRAYRIHCARAVAREWLRRLGAPA
jgi:CO/xanthine dehydrogenase FAD-binding subunit